MLRRSHSSVQQFEIQLQGNSGRNEDIILLSGPPLEAAANHLTGQLILNSLDTMSIKRISVKLIATLRMRWTDNPQHRGTGVQLPLRYEKQIYSQEVSDFDIPGRAVSSNNASQKATPAGSLTNLASYFKHHRNASSTGLSQNNQHNASSNPGKNSREVSPIISRAASSVNLAEFNLGGSGSNGSSSANLHGLSKGGGNSGSKLASLASHNNPNSNNGNVSSTGSNVAHQVPPGNYRFPFEMFVPGDMNESIEGNRHSQVAYWLVATVERGFMQHNLTTKKHVRVVRTVGVDSYDVAHTVSIENTWPKKIEYKIFVPSRAVAIGSHLQIRFAMSPLDKGLKLGRIRAEIVEYVTLATPVAAAREEEYVVARQVYETPGDFDHISDEWIFTRLMDVPRSLARCTQDSTVQPYTKINHKFRCFISLVNGDGHTSELRASLPIILYISPNIYVTGNANVDDTPISSKHSGSSTGLSKLSKHHSSPSRGDDDEDQPMFNVEARSNTSLEAEDTAAPPTYSHHVYDRLYSTVPTPAESPVRSGTSTPGMSRPHSPVSLNNMDANQQAQLAAGLRALAMSRQNSYQSMPALARNDSAVDMTAMSRVPSYDQALGEQAAAADAAPDYSD